MYPAETAGVVMTKVALAPPAVNVRWMSSTAAPVTPVLLQSSWMVKSESPVVSGFTAVTENEWAAV